MEEAYAGRPTTRPIAPPKAKPASKEMQDLERRMLAHPVETIFPLVFWKIRHDYPEMGMLIEERDVTMMDKALANNEQIPVLEVEATHAGIAIRLVDKKDGSMINPQESEQVELDKAIAKKAIINLRSEAPQLVRTLQNELAAGELSNSAVDDVCQALLKLAAARG